jgi:hypothetical protein
MPLHCFRLAPEEPSSDPAIGMSGNNISRGDAGAARLNLSSGGRRMAYDVLEGVKVVELSMYAVAPSAAAILADWGADVVKVVAPASQGSRCRPLTPLRIRRSRRRQ